MIWNDEILFIHTPKTGGMSISRMLENYLEGHVRYTTPDAKKKKNASSKVHYMEGVRHENLCQASLFFAARGRWLKSFEKIFVVMRDPYSLEVSRYKYLRLNHAWDRGPAQRIALESDFKGYLRNAPFFGMKPPRLDLYYAFEGRVPDNLEIIKFEQMDDEIKNKLSPYIASDYKIGRENVTSKDRSNYLKEYDDESEELCYHRHKWFFENEYYARMMF